MRKLESMRKYLDNLDKRLLNEINKDLCSDNKMFRLLQGEVGSGKTIVAFLSAFNTISSDFQVAVMAPTEILARQHFLLAKDFFHVILNLYHLLRYNFYVDLIFSQIIFLLFKILT